MSDSLRPHGLYSARLLCPLDSPGKNTGVGRDALLQGIFPTQGSNSGLLALQMESLPSEPSAQPTSLQKKMFYLSLSSILYLWLLAQSGSLYALKE